jgi:hypothetical protein
MPPVSVTNDQNSDTKNESDDNSANHNNTEAANSETSDNTEKESDILDENKDKDLIKKIDEGFVSDGSETKVKANSDKQQPKQDKKLMNDKSAKEIDDNNHKKPVSQNIYDNIPEPPVSKVNGVSAPIQVLQQIELNETLKSHAINDKRLAPVAANVPYGEYPVSPIKYTGPVTPIQKLETVSLQEAKQYALERAKNGQISDPITKGEEHTKILEQIHVSIPVQQLDINSIEDTKPHPPSTKPIPTNTRPVQPKPTPSKPVFHSSLSPKPVRLEPLSRTPSQSPKVSPKYSPKPSPKQSPVPSRDASKERYTQEQNGTRPSRIDIPLRKDILSRNSKHTSKESPKEVSKDDLKSPKNDNIPQTDKTPLPKSTTKQVNVNNNKKQPIFASPELSADVDLFTSTSPFSKTKGPSDFSHKLIALCRKSDWVGVDTVIKYAIKHNIDPELNAISESSGWTPVMFAVKDNRIQIVEQLLDLGYPVNIKAKVRISFYLYK